MQLKIINPIVYPGWDEILLASGDHSFFHSSAWARTLFETYNYKPFYFIQISQGRLSLMFPLMEIKSILTGKRGVSLPFTDFCDPIIADPGTLKDIMEQLIAYGRNAGWKYIDFRGGRNCLQDTTISLNHYLHELNLLKEEKEIFLSLRGNTRRNIKKALKEGVEVQLLNSFEAVKSFFKLNCMTRKRHGLPPQPFRFFKKIYEHIISKEKGFISLAVFKKKIIAGAVYFHFGKEAIYKFGASDIGYSPQRANNLVMWDAIKWYINNDFKSLSLGITDLGNKGLLQFKRSWGAKEDIVSYYKYDINKETFIRDEFRGKTSYFFFRKMPSPLLNMTGTLIYRHFG